MASLYYNILELFALNSGYFVPDNDQTVQYYSEKRSDGDGNNVTNR